MKLCVRVMSMLSTENSQNKTILWF